MHSDPQPGPLMHLLDVESLTEMVHAHNQTQQAKVRRPRSQSVANSIGSNGIMIHKYSGNILLDAIYSYHLNWGFLLDVINSFSNLAL